MRVHERVDVTNRPRVTAIIDTKNAHTLWNEGVLSLRLKIWNSLESIKQDIVIKSPTGANPPSGIMFRGLTVSHATTQSMVIHWIQLNLPISVGPPVPKQSHHQSAKRIRSTCHWYLVSQMLGQSLPGFDGQLKKIKKLEALHDVSV